MKMPGGLRAFLTISFVAALTVCFSTTGAAQGAQENGSERTFPQSKNAVEQAIRAMQNQVAGRLPVLDGFATAGDHPLDRYQRGYYQSKIQVIAAPSGGSIVRITVQVTAWYNDPAAAHSGYQVLPSNGRLEADLLDQLTDQLARTSQPVPPAIQSAKTVSAPAAPQGKVSAPAAPPATTASASPRPAAKALDRNEPSVSAPVPRIPDAAGSITSSLSETLNEQKTSESDATKKGEDKNSLQAEVTSLEEILKNQTHPNNLVAVKKSGTPVVVSPSLTAKTLFLASAHDEFEVLDFNEDWVHVRISGLSRGWIWRNNLELPDTIPEGNAEAGSSGGTAADLFRVTRQQEAVFPGDWAPLRGKTVEIVSVEKINEDSKDTGPQLRLEFAKSVLDKSYAELAQKQQQVGGIVLIFDSADGGMIAAAMPTLQQWKAGTLSDAAFWHQCFFDPPESFTESATSGTK